DFNDPEFALAFARIECHYFTNRAFFDTDNWLLENAHKIKHIPTEIIHGRYDVVCPVENAWELKKVLPDAQLHIVQDAGHSATEKGIIHHLIEATERFKTIK
ncbi:MAG: prolyl aminopeptidase, partial [Bdellovibrionales bacterium]|nr:prolyl aminopeptidase [Bdellovibrionales bacterium]